MDPTAKLNELRGLIKLATDMDLYEPGLKKYATQEALNIMKELDDHFTNGGDGPEQWGLM